MNREVEERIVAMYFDNKDFEQNAKQTIETLGQLKEGLNLEESAKGFNVFDKIKNAMNFSKANREARNLKNTMTNLTQGISKVANIGMAPVRALDNLFGTFRGYVSKFIGFDLAGKVVNTLESTLRSFTIAPVSAGWDQYQAKMDSVKTIMSGTGESIEVVEQHLKNLTDYANKTIYSLSDMTSNLGKFTNNGVKLEDATAAMQGIANATADAGQGAQSASMAMYNISQAIGVGKMTTIDWKSLENANIATQKLKNTFLEVAAAGGRIQKETDGQGIAHYWLTKDDDGKALKEKIELTSANFREYLQKGWLDKDTLLKTFQIYSGNGITVDLLKSWGINDVETQKRLMAIGEEALNAAQEVRTFQKMMDALKESAQSGWADSFQIIFGNMEEGTTLWTRMSEEIDKVLTGSANKRNEVLKQWSEMSEAYDSIYYGTDEKGNKRKVKKGGREILIDSFFEMIDVIKEVGKVFSDTFHKVFGEIDAKKLMDVTLGFRNLVRNAKAWLGDVNTTGSRLNKISRILSGVFNIIKIGFNVIKAGFNLVKRLAGPAIDVFLDVFSVIGDFLTGTGELNFGQLFAKIGEGFTKLWEKIKSVFMPKNLPGGGTELPIITWIKERWNKLKEIVKQWAKDNGLSGILEGFANFTNAITGWSGWNDIAAFFTNAKDTIVNAWEEVKGWGVWKSIGNFLTNAWEWILDITGLRPKEESALDKKKKELTEEMASMNEIGTATKPGENGFFGGIIGWINQAWEDIQRVWNSTIGSEEAKKNFWIPISEFFTNTWEWIKGAADTTADFFTKTTESGGTGFTDWLDGIWKGIVEAWDGIKTAVEPIATDVVEFLTNTWSWICTQAGLGADAVVNFFTKPDGQTGETGFVSWLREIWGSIETFWNDTIMGTAKPLWEKIAKFATDTWGWISSQFTVQRYDDRGFALNNPKAPIETWLSGIWNSIENFWNNTIMGAARPLWEKIAKFASDTWGWIRSQFTVKRYDDRGFELNNPKAPIETWLSGIWESVKGVWNEVVGWEGWAAIGEFLSNTWGWITGLFSGSGSATAGAGEESVKMAEENAQAITETTKEGGFLERAIDSVGKFFERVLGSIKGSIPEGVTEFITNLTSLAGQIFGFIGDLMGTLSRVISTIRTGDTSKLTSGDITTIFVGVIGVIGTIVLKLLNNKWLSKIGDTHAQTLGLQILEFGAGMMLIASALALLSSVDQEKMKNGALALGALMLAFGAIAYTIGKYGGKKETEKVSGVERFFTNLVNQVAKFAIITVIVKSLPEIISAIGEAKRSGAGAIGEDFLKVAEGVAVLIGTIGIVLTAAQKLSGSNGLDPRAALSTTLAISLSVGAIGAIFSFIGGLPEVFKSLGIDGIQEQGLKNLDNATETMVKFGESIGRFFGAIVGAFTGQKDASNLTTTAQGISDATKTAETITEDQMNHLTMVMGMMGTLQDSLPGYKDVWDKWLNENKLAKLGDQLPSLGKGLSDLHAYVQDLSPEDLNQLLETGRILGQFGNAMALVAQALTMPQRNMWGGAIWDKAVFQEYQQAATQLADAVRQGLTNEQGEMSGLEFNAMPIIEAIINALKIGETAIGHAVRDMVQAGLNMVDSDRGSYNEIRVPQEVTDALQNAGKLVNENGETFTISDVLSGFLGEDGEYNKLMSTFDEKTGALEEKMKGLMGTFTDSSWFEFKDEAGNDIDIIGTLQGHLDTLSESLNKMDPLTVKITPVFDTTNFTPQTLQQQLNTMPIQFTPGTVPSKVTFEFKGLNEELNMTAIYNKLEQIRAAEVAWGLQNVVATNNLGRDIDGIAAEISRMKLYLDTGALVGGILPYVDAGLYKRSVTASRTGTVSMN